MTSSEGKKTIKLNKSAEIDPSVFADTREYPSDTPDGSNPFVIDFAQVASGNEPVPAGTYNVTIVAAEPTTSKNGNAMIKLRHRINDEGDHHKRIIFDQLVFTQGALWRVRQLLEALGYDDTFKGEVNPENLLGEQLVIKVTVQAGNGVNPETGEPYAPKNNVAKYLPAGTSQKVADLL